MSHEWWPILKEFPNSWCAYTEGTKTKNNFRSRNSKIGRGGTKECEWSILWNKKHSKNVGPIRYCEPPLLCQSPGVASRTPAIAIAQAACDVHNDDNDNA